MRWGSCCLGFFYVASQLIVPKFSCISESPRNLPQIYCDKIIRGVLERVFWTNSMSYLLGTSGSSCGTVFLFSIFSALSFASGSVLLRIPNVRMKSIWYVINILVWLNLMCHFFRNANGGIWDSDSTEWGWMREEKLCFLAPKMALLRESFLLLPSHKVSPTYKLCTTKKRWISGGENASKVNGKSG